MRIIDKTPLQDENGEINIIARIQGTLKYGLNWYGELEAQKLVIAQLDRLLEKGFVLIRNFTLPNSEIVIPIILIGAGGIWVLHVTNARGYFEAKGDQWNTVSNGRSQPARINLLSRVSQVARVFQKYLDINKFNLPVTVEPILLASDPGAQIESVRPVARVVRSDALKQFAASLIQARPVISVGAIYDLADQIIDPNLRKTAELQKPEPENQPAERARAIFNSSDTDEEFNPANLGFEFKEEGAEQPVPVQPVPEQHRPQRRPAPAKSGLILGMSRTQLIMLAVMLFVECCVLIGFAFLLFQ
jgi:hypothetical protein